MATRKVTFYVQLVPVWADGQPLQLWEVTPARMTVRPPREPLPGAIVVPVVLNVEEDLFGPLDPVYALVEPDADSTGVRLAADHG